MPWDLLVSAHPEHISPGIIDPEHPKRVDEAPFFLLGQEHNDTGLSLSLHEASTMSRIKSTTTQDSHFPYTKQAQCPASRANWKNLQAEAFHNNPCTRPCFHWSKTNLLPRTRIWQRSRWICWTYIPKTKIHQDSWAYSKLIECGISESLCPGTILR